MKKIKIPSALGLSNDTVYSFSDFLAEFVWGASYWRDIGQPKRQKIALDLYAALNGKQAGTEVLLEDEHYLHLLVVASVPNQTLPGLSGIVVLNMLESITAAETVKSQESSGASAVPDEPVTTNASAQSPEAVGE